MDKAIEEIKLIKEIKVILENKKLSEDYLSLNHLPPEEAKIFLASVNNLDQYFIKLQLPSLDKNETKRWALIYITLHDLLHSEIKHQDITKLEIFATAPIFELTRNILTEKDLEKLSISYFLLGLSSLKINHSLEYLISEKLILGEFVFIGGVEKGIWGLKFKYQFLLEAVTNVFKKVQNDRHNFLLKKYKNLVFDFLEFEPNKKY